jgi:hypothetical protein
MFCPNILPNLLSLAAVLQEDFHYFILENGL